MKYSLMHKDIVVAELELDEATGSIQKICGIVNSEHFPVGIGINGAVADRANLNEWWIDRSIPASRSGIRKALEALDLANTRMLLTRCLGLSLSDHYWIRPSDSTVEWSNVNFFDNPFSEDIGDVLLGKAVKDTGFDFHSPDNTSDGCLKKRWKIIDDKRCLIKAGSNPFMQQPFNEVAATALARRLGIPHTPYTLMWDDGVPYSVCEDFVTRDTELVSAWRVMQISKKSNNTSVYRHYINRCETLGIADIVHAVDQMIVLDYILANEDRHQNNFGLIRNADTLEWLGAAPIFDSGSSLGYDKLTSQIAAEKGIDCKPFKKTHDEQLRLVSSFDWICFDHLSGIEEELYSIFDQAGEFMDSARKQAIVASVRNRIRRVEEQASASETAVDLISADVTENIAETYDTKQ